MTQHFFAADTAPLETNLDANFTDLYTVTAPLKANTDSVSIGTSISAWRTGAKALQFGTLGGLNVQQNGAATFSFAAYESGSNVFSYTTTGDLPAKYSMVSGAHAWSTAAAGTAGGTVTFTQAMTLDGAGNLLLGQAGLGYSNSNSVSLQVGANQGVFVANHATGAISGTTFAAFGYGGSSIGSITQSGTTAVLYNTTSDERLKDNIADAADAGPTLDAVKVRQYDWKSDGSHQRFGFVAQELVAVVPEAVHSPADPDEMMAVDYSKLVPLLVKEVQSLRARLHALDGQ